MSSKSALTSTTILGSLAFVFASHIAMADDMKASDLLNLSLEQLSNIEVTSVSKKSEKASEAAAAIYVITQEDIHRSGLTSIPELLRMVPGLNVAQSGAHQWAVSSRGFNDQFANKLLVLIDGRSVYTPLYSGVYWDVQDTPLQDIERIEVIRGPGATLWGANAVNGVINIITKSAKDTQGGYASLTAGSQEKALTTARYGAKLADNAYMRVYAKYDDRDEVRSISNQGAHDAWNKAQSGFRADWKHGDSQSLTFQGDIYQTGGSGVLNFPGALAASPTREFSSGGNLLGKWDNKVSSTSEFTLQTYYDDARRDNLVFSSNIQTVDLDMQHIWTSIDRNEIIWGAGYRLVKSDVTGSAYISYVPESRSDNLFSAFLQDKITLHPNDVFLTLGSKFEHNDYTGFEMQPSARLSWLVDSKQTVWSSVSRAVRTPNISVADNQFVIAPLPTPPYPPSSFLAQTGAKNLKSEELVAYELGYRVQPVVNVSLDTAVFYNDYSSLLLGVLGPVTGPGATPIPGSFIQQVLPLYAGTAHSWGLETSAKWNPVNYLELSASYTLQQFKFDQPDPYGYSFAGKSPQQQFNIQSTLKLPHNLELTSAFYYVDSLTAMDLNTHSGIPDYTRLDMRLAWEATDNIELSLVGQNLLDNSHQEFSGFLFQNSSQIPRSVYGNVTLKF